MVKLTDVRRILCSVHALDQFANFVLTILLTIFCWKFHCSFEMRPTDVVVSQFYAVPLFYYPTDIMIETNTFTDSSGGTAENN